MLILRDYCPTCSKDEPIQATAGIHGRRVTADGTPDGGKKLAISAVFGSVALETSTGQMNFSFLLTCPNQGHK